jgi:multidrug efflux pump subunit AcrA (membrane-fusion protein)
LKRAESALKLELGRQKIAETELSILQQGAKDEDGELDDALVLREPQLDAAHGDLAAARARLDGARLDLSRTSFAPRFDAVIVESNAEIGQLATPQTRLARLVGTETFWVRVPLEKDKLPHVSIAGIEDDEGSRVTVTQEVGEQIVKREGKVVRLLSNLEPGSRMARILVEIADPYGLKQESDAQTRPYPILLDAYVEVLIHGKSERDLVEVPRKALHQGDTVHVYSDGALEIRKVDVAWRLPDSVLVAKGLDDSERVIISPLAAPVPKMKLRDVTAREKPAK